MSTDFTVAEVQLSYKNQVPCKDRQIINSSATAYNIVKNHFPDETIDYMESFKVLLTNAQGVILAHNHPSENIQPSGQFKRIF